MISGLVMNTCSCMSVVPIADTGIGPRAVSTVASSLTNDPSFVTVWFSWIGRARRRLSAVSERGPHGHREARHLGPRPVGLERYVDDVVSLPCIGIVKLATLVHVPSVLNFKISLVCTRVCRPSDW